MLQISKCSSHIFAQRKLSQKYPLPVDSKKMNNRISNDYINNNHPVTALMGAAQHMAGEKLFGQLDVSQAYYGLQKAHQSSIETLASNFACRTFAYRRLVESWVYLFRCFPILFEITLIQSL